jgi:hypothetical protein
MDKPAWSRGSMASRCTASSRARSVSLVTASGPNLSQVRHHCHRLEILRAMDSGMISSVEEYSRGGAADLDFGRLPGTTKSSDIDLSDEPVRGASGRGNLDPAVAQSPAADNEPLFLRFELWRVVLLQMPEPADEL